MKLSITIIAALAAASVSALPEIGTATICLRTGYNCEGSGACCKKVAHNQCCGAKKSKYSSVGSPNLPKPKNHHVVGYQVKGGNPCGNEVTVGSGDNVCKNFPNLRGGTWHKNQHFSDGQDDSVGKRLPCLTPDIFLFANGTEIDISQMSEEEVTKLEDEA